MMHETKSVSTLWSILSCVLVLCLIVAGTVMVLSGCNNQGNGDVELYWNVDQDEYVAKGLNGASGRMPRSDGFYYVRLAVNGEQEDFRVADQAVVDRIDMVEILCPIFDEEGVIVDIKTVNECTGGLLANALYVTNVDGNTITGNTQGTLKGFDMTFEITEETEIYSVGGTGLLVGVPCKINVDDEVIAIKDYDGKISYVFVRGYEAPGDIYWNQTRMYNSTTAMTTRQSDALGYYVFDMCLNGEMVKVRTRDAKVANSIDAKAAKCTALTFDEEGFCTGVLGTSAEGCPTTFASWATVLEISGDMVYAKKFSGSDMGAEHTGYLSKDCKIIDTATGEYTELRVGDQIHGLKDRRGRVCYIFVITRLSEEGEIYWNVERKYSSANASTTRTPAGDGYYYLKMATLGKSVTVKTKDKALVNTIDSNGARCCVLNLDSDNEIISVKGASTKHGGGTFGSWYYVDKIEGNQLTVSRILTGNTTPTVQVGTMSKDIEIINGSTNFNYFCGEYTELKVGDRVHGLCDLNGEIRVLYVVERMVNSPVYWNVNRMYNSITKMSNRTRAADGYFYVTLAVNGQQVEYKTKSQEVINSIDATAACCFGLSVSNGVIYKYYSIGTVIGCQGGTRSMSWVDVTKVEGTTFEAKKNSAGHALNGMYFGTAMAYNCKVYNVSSGYAKYAGEPTTVQLGDRVHVLHNKEGYATHVFVVDGRTKPLNTEPNACPCEQDVTWEPWDGTTELQNGKSYYLTQDIEAPYDGFLIEGLRVNLRLDGHTISSSGRCFFIKNGGKLNICDHGTRGKLVGDGVDGEAGGVLRMYSSVGGATVNVWNVDLIHTGAVKAKEGGVISTSGPMTLHNVNVSGGTTTSKGGNVLVNPAGIFRMFGGTVSGGVAGGNGGNIYVNDGSIYLEGVTVTNGNGTAAGDNIYIGSSKQMHFKDLTVTNTLPGGTGVQFRSGTVALEGKIDISQNAGSNLVMTAGAVFQDKGMDSTSKIIVKLTDEYPLLTGAASDLSGCFVSEKPKDYAVVYDADAKQVNSVCMIVPQTHDADHCLCVGKASGLGDHTCATVTGWQELTADKLVNCIGTTGTSTGVKLIADGNYYLTRDLALSGALCILPGQNINLCLNGCEITSPHRALLVAGNLNITDCKGEGIVCGAESTNGGTAKVVRGGVLNLYAGTMTCSTANSSGGVVVVSQDSGYITSVASDVIGTFNMYGGTVSGGKSTEGGNITVWHNAVFNMYGGTVTGGESARGANLFISGKSDSCTVKLLGGTISNGTGSGVYLAKGTVTLGGQMTISGNSTEDIYLVGGETMALNGLNTTQKIRVTVDVPGVAFTNVTTDLSNSFESTNDDYKIIYNETDKTLEIKDPTAVAHEHCVCMGLNSEHTCSNVIWKPWDGTTPLTAGNWYLTDDVTITDPAGIKVGAKTINICLNGHTITGEGRVFWLDNGSSVVNVCDHPGNSGALEGKGVVGEPGGVIRNGMPTGRVGLYNITVRRVDTGTRVAVKEGGAISCSGYLDMYHVVVENGYATGKGGNILAALTAKVNIHDSVIRNGVTTGNLGGGNLSVSGNNTSNKVLVTLVDTTISGGSATNSAAKGADVYLNQASINTMTLGGKIVIDDLYMQGNGNLNIQDAGLKSGSSITVEMAAPGVIGTSKTDASGYFHLSDDAKEVKHESATSTLTVVAKAAPAHTDHCVCAGDCQNVGGHTCSTLTGWTELTMDQLVASGSYLKFASSGNYYLSGDLTLDKSIEIAPGQTITICLNGHKITDSVRMFRVNGVLNITDCGTTGQLIGTSRLAPVAYGYANGVINLYGGTLSSGYTGTTKATWGGVVALAKDKGAATAEAASSMNMYGGKIIGTSVYLDTSTNKYGFGGAIATMGTSTHPCTFTMYGGQVIGGYAELGGSAIGISDCDSVKLLGGTITGTAGDTSLVYTTKVNAKVEVGGTAKVGSIQLLEGVKLKISGTALTGDASIGITLTADGVFAEEVQSDLSGYFHSTTNGKDVFYDAANKTLSVGNAAVHQNHPVCEGALAEHDDCSCPDVTWIALTQDMFNNPDGDIVKKGTVDGGSAFQLKAGGHYYLKEDITLNLTLTPGLGNEISLCLNGHTIQCTVDRTIYFKGTVNLCDCQYTDQVLNEGKANEKLERTYKGTVTGQLNSHAAVVYPRADGTLNFYSGNLRGVTITAAGKGGGVGYISGAMNMYGGKVYGGSSTGVGGNLTVVDAGVFTMYGGLITGGRTTTMGGNLYISNATNKWGAAYIYGGEIIGGTAGESGGNIYQKDGTTLVIDGAVISGGTAGTHGGNIWVGKATTGHAGYFNLLNAKVLNGQANTSSGDGGNICIDGTATLGTNRIENSEIGYDSSWGTKNSAFKGGNIRIYGGQLTIKDSVLHSGRTPDEGGNLNVKLNAKVTLTGNTVIRDGVSGKNGGNIAVFGTLNIEGNTHIKDGTASARGANITAYGNTATDKAYINMTGGRISGGSASMGGSVRLESNSGSATLTMTGGIIEACGATSNGTGVFLGPGANNKLIVGGTAQICEVWLASGKTLEVHSSGFSTGAMVNITMAAAGNIASGLNSAIDYTAFIRSYDSGMKVVQEGDKLVLKSA